MAHLDIAAEEMNEFHVDHFGSTQEDWRREVRDSIDNMHVSSVPVQVDAVQRRDVLKQARDMHNVYEEQLKRANELYMEVCAVRLQLEQREKALAE